MHAFKFEIANVYQNLTNVVLRLAPADPRAAAKKAVLLNAHYDSTLGTKGEAGLLESDGCTAGALCMVPDGVPGRAVCAAGAGRTPLTAVTKQRHGNVARRCATAHAPPCARATSALACIAAKQAGPRPRGPSPRDPAPSPHPPLSLTRAHTHTHSPHTTLHTRHERRRLGLRLLRGYLAGGGAHARGQS